MPGRREPWWHRAPLLLEVVRHLGNISYVISETFPWPSRDKRKRKAQFFSNRFQTVLFLFTIANWKESTIRVRWVRLLICLEAKWMTVRNTEMLFGGDSHPTCSFSLPAPCFPLLASRFLTPLFVPQEPVNNMASTRSTVAFLAFLVGLVQLAAASKVCSYCETIPDDCFGSGNCAALSGTTQLQAKTTANVARKVCVTQGDIPSPFTMSCTADGTALDISSGSCSNKIYLFTETSAGKRVVFRSGSSGFPLSNLSVCTAQRGYCLTGTLAAGDEPVIDITTSPWQVKVGTTKICNLATGFASNNFQLYCA
jgi:hypothetical protein